MELRLVRLAFSAGFFMAIVMIMVDHDNVWYYAVGAGAFGIFAGFLWHNELQNQADARANQDIQRQRQEREQAQGRPGGPGGGWS